MSTKVTKAELQKQLDYANKTTKHLKQEIAVILAGRVGVAFLSNMIGVDRHTIKDWIEQGLSATRKPDEIFPKIEIRDLVQFLQERAFENGLMSVKEGDYAYLATLHKEAVERNRVLMERVETAEADVAAYQAAAGAVFHYNFERVADLLTELEQLVIAEIDDAVFAGMVPGRPESILEDTGDRRHYAKRVARLSDLGRRIREQRAGLPA